jgi:hypothetical protein
LLLKQRGKIRRASGDVLCAMVEVDFTNWRCRTSRRHSSANSPPFVEDEYGLACMMKRPRTGKPCHARADNECAAHEKHTACWFARSISSIGMSLMLLGARLPPPILCYQPLVPGPPLNGPRMRSVIQPP